MICAYCKSRVFEADRKCPACGSTVFIADAEPTAREGTTDAGRPQEPPEVHYQTFHHTVYVKPSRSSRNRWIALLLCLLGGIFGIHRFYTGKIATGVLYIFTGGLFGVGVVIDFLVILFGYFRDDQGLLLDS